MCRAVDLARVVVQPHFDAVNWDVSPAATLFGEADDLAASPTGVAAAAVLVRLDQYVQDLVVVCELEAGDLQIPLELKQLRDKVRGTLHGASPGYGFLIGTRREAPFFVVR